MAAVGVWAMAVTAEAQALKPVPLDDAAKMGGLIGDRLTARPAKPRKVLVFWRCEGFVHGEAIEYGNKALELAAQFPWAETGCIEVRPVRDVAAVRRQVGARPAHAPA